MTKNEELIAEAKFKITREKEYAEILAEVIRNIVREKNVIVSMPGSNSPVSCLTITVKLSTRQSVFFCKKINEKVVSCISGAYRLVIIDYQYGDEIIYNFTRTTDKQGEGFNFGDE